MAGPYGDKKVAKSSEGYISEALRGGGSGKSEEIFIEKVDRKNQTINTASAMDNVELAMDIPSSIISDERGFHGSTRNLKHSIDGAEAPADGDVGAAGPVTHDIIPDH